MFKRITIVFFIILIFIAVSGMAYFRGRYVVPILTYHYFTTATTSKNDGLAISEEIFRRQMRFLKDHRYNVVSLEALADLIRAGKKIPARTVAITFDDGYADNYKYAFPILKEYNFPATIFIITNEVGTPYRLSWKEIKTMRDSGLITFGSHALGPEPLINIKDETVLKKEVFHSKVVLEDKLGVAVNIFAYPEGMFNEKIRQLVIDAGYKAAVTTIPGKPYPNDDIFAIKRLRISRNAGNMLVFAIETSGYYTAMKEYKKLRKAKKAK